MDHSGGQEVSKLAVNSDDPSLNPTDVFSVKLFIKSENAFLKGAGECTKYLEELEALAFPVRSSDYYFFSCFYTKN